MANGQSDSSERRFDDRNAEWRGQIEARVQGLERRLEGTDQRAGVLGDGIVSLRVDMSAVRQELHQLSNDVRQASTDLRNERNTLVSDLKDTMRQRRLTGVQIALALVAPVIAAVLTFLILTALTGTPTVR